MKARPARALLDGDRRRTPAALPAMLAALGLLAAAAACAAPAAAPAGAPATVPLGTPAHPRAAATATGPSPAPAMAPATEAAVPTAAAAPVAGCAPRRRGDDGGAALAAMAPAAVAEALLRAHFCNGLALDAAAVQSQSPWLTDDLRRRLLAWLAQPQSPDEVPDLNGDPWTDSQEYPTRYAVRPAVVRGEVAEVPVAFVLAPRRWQVTMLMRRVDGRWRVADLRYRGGETLTQLLK